MLTATPSLVVDVLITRAAATLTAGSKVVMIFFSPKQIMDYFSTDERPVTTEEFMDFWNSLSNEDKAYYQLGV